MAQQVESLAVGYEDHASAGANAAAAAIKRVGDEAVVTEERVRRAAKSGETLARQYGETERLAAKVAEVTKRYARELADLDASELGAAEKAKLYTTIIAARDAAIQKATAAHERWVAGMRASEAAANAQAAGMAAATGATGSWTGALAQIYQTAGTATGAVQATTRAIQALNADFRAGTAGFADWLAGARALEGALRGVSAAQRAINENTGVARQNVNTVTIGPTKYATTGAGASGGNTLSLVTGDAQAAARRQADIVAAFAATDAELEHYRETLGLVDVAQRKFAAGQADLQATIRRSGIELEEGQRILAAYADAFDPSRQVLRAKEQLASEWQALLIEEGLREQERVAQTKAAVAANWEAMLAAEGWGAREAKAKLASEWQALLATEEMQQRERIARTKAQVAAAWEAQIATEEMDRPIKEAAALQAVIDKADPARAKLHAFTEELKLLQAAEAKGDPRVVGNMEALTAALRRQHGVLDTTAGKTKLAAHEVTNLSYQMQDVAVQLQAGTNPFTIMLQQGTQVVGAVGGVGRLMGLIFSPTGVAVMGVGALAAGFGVVLARVAQVSAETRALGTTLKALNPDLNATAESLRKMAFDVADQRGVARSDISGAIQAVVQNSRINSAPMVKQIVGLSADMEAVLGGGIDKMAAKLSDAFGAGVPGVRKLDDEINFLSVAQAKQIEIMGRQGDAAGALRIAIEALEQRYGGAAKTMRSEWGVAISEIGRAWDAFIDGIATSKVGKAAAEAAAQAARGWRQGLAGMTPAEQIDDLRKKLAANDAEARRLPERTSGVHADYEAVIRRRIELTQQLRRLEAPQDPARTAPPAHRAANDLTPDIEGMAQAQKWLNSQTLAYDDLSKAMQGNAMQRDLNRAKLDAEREATEKNLGPTQRLALIELRRKEVLLQQSVAVSDAVREAGAAAAASQRLADAQAKGGDISMAQARAQNVLNENLTRGVPPAQALALAVLDYQKSLADLGGQQRAWNRDLSEQIRVAAEVAQAEAVSGAAVGEANIQNRIRAQILKEGVPLESERARAIEAGTRALDAQTAAARVNNAIRGQNEQLALARAEYDLLGSTNAERERAMGQMRAALEVQNDPAWAQMPKELQEAWVQQAGAVAEYNSRLGDAKQAASDFSSSVTKGLEDIIVEGGKAGDVLKELGKSVERGVVRELFTKPANEIITGGITKLLAPRPANDNMVQPVNDNDPGGWVSRFLGLSSKDSSATALGSTAKNAMWVQLSAGGAALAMPQMAGSQPVPVAIADAGSIPDLIAREADAQGVPRDVALSLAKIESGFRQYTADGRVYTSSAGAQGVMQLMPGTAAGLGVDPTDTKQNIAGGIRFLAQLGKQFGGDWTNAVAAYNAGPSTVQAYLRGDRASLPAETVAHLQKFGAAMKASAGTVVSFGQATQTQTSALAAQTTSTAALTDEQQRSIDGALTAIQGSSAITTDAATDLERSLGDFSDGAATAADRLVQSQTDAAAGTQGFTKSLADAGDGLSSWLQKLFAMLSGSSGSSVSVTGGSSGASGIFNLLSTSARSGSAGGGDMFSGVKNWLNTPIFRGSPSYQNAGPGIDDGTAGYDTTGAFDSGGNAIGGDTGGMTYGQAGGAVLGAAAAGYGAGRMVKRGNKAGGALAGAASGAMMGASAGPWGMLIGAIVGAIAGLIGAGNKPSNFGTGGSYDAVAGRTYNTWTDKYDGQVQAARGQVEQSLGKITDALRSVGARWDSMVVNYSIGSRDDWKGDVNGKEIVASKEDPELFLTQITKAMGAQAKGLGEDVAFVFAHSTANKLEALLKEVDFADNFQRSLTRLKSTASLAASAFDEGAQAGKEFAQSIGDFLRQTAQVFKAALPVDTPNTFFGKSTLTFRLQDFVTFSGQRHDSGDGDGGAADGSGDGGDGGGGAGGAGGAGYATGTMSAPPGWAWVGEKGPELMRFRGGEQVLPHHVSVQYARSVQQGFAEGAYDPREITLTRNDAEYWGLHGAGTAELTGPGFGWLSGFAGDLRGNDGRIEEQLARKIAEYYVGATKEASDYTKSFSNGPVFGSSGEGAQQNIYNHGLVDAASVLPGGLQPSSIVQWGEYDSSPLAKMTNDAVANMRTSLLAIVTAYKKLGEEVPRQTTEAITSVDAELSRRGVETNETQYARLNARLAELGIGPDQISQVGGWVDAAAAGTTLDYAKIPDAQAAITMVSNFAKALVEAGKPIPEQFTSITKQLEALDASRIAIDAQVSGKSGDITQGEAAVEKAKGYWKSMLSAMSEVGWSGDVAAQKQATGLHNAITKIQTDYSKGMDSTLRGLKREGAYDTGEGYVDTYKATLRDITAIWTDQGDRARETAKANEILNLSFKDLAAQGGTSAKTFRDLMAAFADAPEAVSALQTSLNTFLTDTKANGLAVIQKAIDPDYRPTADQALRSINLDGSKLGGFTTAFQGFIDKANAGAVSADDLRGMYARLNEQLDAGTVTGDQYNAVLGSLTDTYSTATQAIRDHITALKGVITGEQAWRQSVRLGDLSTLDPKKKLDEALAQYTTLRTNAQGGDTTAYEQLDSVRNTVLELAHAYYASSSGYAQIFNQLQEDSHGLESVATKQLHEAQRQTGLLETIATNTSIATDTPWTTLQKQIEQVVGQRDLYSSGTDSLGRSMADAQADTGLTRGQYQAIVRLTGYTGVIGQGGHNQALASDATYRQLWLQAIGYAQGLVPPVGAHQFGGVVGGYATGGVVGNGLFGVDSVLARYAGGGTIALAGGEGILTASATAAIGGAAAVEAINRTGRLPANDRWLATNVTPIRRPSGGGADMTEVVAELRRLGVRLAKIEAAIHEAEAEAQGQRAKFAAMVEQKLREMLAEQRDLPNRIANGIR